MHGVSPIGGGSYWAGRRAAHFWALVGRPYTWPAHFLGNEALVLVCQEIPNCLFCFIFSTYRQLWSNRTELIFHLKTMQYMHRRSQDFVWGCTFFIIKLTTFILVVALEIRSKTTKETSKSNQRSKNVLKLILALLGGCISCRGGALTNFPCKLRLIFSPLCMGGADAPTAPHGYAYKNMRYKISDIYFSL